MRMQHTQQTNNRPEGFKNSVVSYPNRGPWGKSGWRGNCSGHIIRDSLGSFYDWSNPNSLFVDPSEGSGTSGDVARELGIRYSGLDLHSGFNLLRDNMIEAVGEPAQMAFWHPPYHNMVRYGRDVWGNGQTHPDDLSECESLSDFVEKCQVGMMNIYDGLTTDGKGVYCVLIGNLRAKGNYYDLTDMLKRVAPGKLREVIIKLQHNCMSDKRQYAGNVIRIAHETLLVFEKDARIQSALDFAALIEHRVKTARNMTWRSAIKRAMMGKDRVHLTDIYAAVADYAKARGSNKNWEAKVRQVVRRQPEDFEVLGNGYYKAKAA